MTARQKVAAGTRLDSLGIARKTTRYCLTQGYAGDYILFTSTSRQRKFVKTGGG